MATTNLYLPLENMDDKLLSQSYLENADYRHFK